jgi:hypothetical protein
MASLSEAAFVVHMESGMSKNKYSMYTNKRSHDICHVPSLQLKPSYSGALSGINVNHSFSFSSCSYLTVLFKPKNVIYKGSCPAPCSRAPSKMHLLVEACPVSPHTCWTHLSNDWKNFEDRQPACNDSEKISTMTTCLSPRAS